MNASSERYILYGLPTYFKHKIIYIYIYLEKLNALDPINERTIRLAERMRDLVKKYESGEQKPSVIFKFMQFYVTLYINL